MEQNLKTPILFIIFNRPDTTEKVFNAIRRARPQQLFIAADGPRANKIGEKELCEETRMFVAKIDWPCEVRTLFREKNLGCGKAVSSAITWFFENVEQGIILEDDCLPIDSFFPFCQLMLEKYKDSKEIGIISGTNYLFGYNNFDYSYYFSKHCYIWGWATWKRTWELYNLEMTDFPSKKFLNEYFEDKLTSNYYREQFNEFKHSKINTWDIQLTATLIKNRLYSIIPLNNQVSNIGLSGTHTNKKIPLSINMPTKPIGIDNIKYPKVGYIKILDLISIKNIVYKIVRKPFYKKILLKIIKRKHLNLLKRILRYN